MSKKFDREQLRLAVESWNCEMETIKNLATSVSNTIFGDPASSIKKLTTPSKESPEDLICEVWLIYIYDGFQAALRNDYTAMYELYFPELDMSLNTGIYSPDKINVMFGQNKRYLPKDKNKSIGNEPNPECVDIRCMTGTDALRFRELCSAYKGYQELEKQAITLLKETIKPLKKESEPEPEDDE